MQNYVKESPLIQIYYTDIYSKYNYLAKNWEKLLVLITTEATF